MTTKFKTLEVKPLTDQIHRVRLSPLEGDVFEFKGGQYLFLHLPDGKKIPLSIASAPEQKDYIELHIRSMHAESLAAEMLSLFQTADVLEIDAPHGNCILRDGKNPVIIIAGGTGFSPMKSLLESAFVGAEGREFALYLGAQTKEEIYQSPIIEGWQTNQVTFKYTPVVFEVDDSWKGATGYPHEAAIADYQDKLSNCDVFISGSEPMVMNVYKALTEKGVPPNQIYSDILDIKRASGDIE